MVIFHCLFVQRVSFGDLRHHVFCLEALHHLQRNCQRLSRQLQLQARNWLETLGNLRWKW